MERVAYSAQHLIFGVYLALGGSVMDAVNSLAKYILALERSAAATARAEDRPIYELLLADAGPILAAALESAAPATMALRISQHERVWGHSWLQDPAYQGASDAWQQAKLACGHVAV